MKYCKKCLQPDTRPNIIFSDDGYCPACSYFTKTQNIDWDERFEIIKDIISKYPRKKGQHFDCIIGVSGGKDSTRQAIWARDKLGLNPLLVCLSYPPEQITDRGAKNISNLIELGFDTLVISPAPITWRKVVREGFLRFKNWAKATELALMGSAPQIAIKYDIPLILWGENPGLQLGDIGAIGKTGFDGNNLRYLNTLAGGEMQWMLDMGFSTKDLVLYKYPSSLDFEDAGVQIVYLGWFWNDWSLINNGLYSVTYGLSTREEDVTSTGDITRVSSLDEDWVTLNQMIKFYKFGFGRVADYVNESIRYNVITREEGIELCEEYDGNCSDEYIESFCNYIDITIEDFWIKVKSAANKNLFEIDMNGNLNPKFKVGYGIR